MNLLASRQFSSSGGPEKKDDNRSANDYESGFENLMKEGNISKEESEQFAQRRQERAKQSQEQQEKFDKMHADKFKEGEQDFDDFLAGKKQETSAGQDLKNAFQSFYAKMKEQDKKLKATMKSLDEKEGISLNSAKASLNSFSSKLEARRQAYREQRKQAEAEKEAAAKAAEEKASQDAAKDQSQSQQETEQKAK